MNLDDKGIQGPAWERQVLEKLAFAMLDERKSARRWSLFWRMVWLGLDLVCLPDPAALLSIQMVRPV